MGKEFPSYSNQFSPHQLLKCTASCHICKLNIYFQKICFYYSLGTLKVTEDDATNRREYPEIMHMHRKLHPRSSFPELYLLQRPGRSWFFGFQALSCFGIFVASKYSASISVLVTTGTANEIGPCYDARREENDSVVKLNSGELKTHIGTAEV